MHTFQSVCVYTFGMVAKVCVCAWTEVDRSLDSLT